MTKYYLDTIKFLNSTIPELIELSKNQSVVGFQKDCETKTLKLTIDSENVSQVINTIKKNMEKAPWSVSLNSFFYVETNLDLTYLSHTTSDYKLSELKNEADGKELILYFTLTNNKAFFFK